MAAKKKTASRRATAKAKGKKAGKRPATKKAVKKKVAAKRKVRAKKKAAPRRVMASVSPAVAELDRRIALVQNNLRDLTEQAAATSGSATEEALSERIANQEAELRRLRAERDAAG